jgi:dienelactone hydrolase
MRLLRCRKLIAFAAVTAAFAAPAQEASAAQLRNYFLGDVTLPDRSPFGPIPVRLQGAIAVPDGGGRHPLVVVVHGRHATGCPFVDDFGSWPCADSEQRNDLGLRHVLRALAERGIVALSPDVNAAHTEGWGEPDDLRRWPRIVNRTLAVLARDVRLGGASFGIELGDRVRLRRIGLLGHSRSGFNAARMSRKREGVADPARIARGLGPVSSLFLLAPVSGARLPDLPTAVVVGTCDQDTGREGRRYLKAARRQAGRRRPVFELTLRQANHNFYNRTLSRLGQDDAAGVRGRCRRPLRLRAAAQQRWIAGAAADFFAVTLRHAPRPDWLRRSGSAPARVYGRAVGLRRFVP